MLNYQKCMWQFVFLCKIFPDFRGQSELNVLEFTLPALLVDIRTSSTTIDKLMVAPLNKYSGSLLFTTKQIHFS